MNMNFNSIAALTEEVKQNPMISTTSTEENAKPKRKPGRPPKKHKSIQKNLYFTDVAEMDAVMAFIKHRRKAIEENKTEAFNDLKVSAIEKYAKEWRRLEELKKKEVPQLF